MAAEVRPRVAKPANEPQAGAQDAREASKVPPVEEAIRKAWSKRDDTAR
jgi:hypothetical protein